MHPGVIRWVVSEGGFQPVAIPSLAGPCSLTPPGRGVFGCWVALYTF